MYNLAKYLPSHFLQSLAHEKQTIYGLALYDIVVYKMSSHNFFVTYANGCRNDNLSRSFKYLVGMGTYRDFDILNMMLITKIFYKSLLYELLQHEIYGAARILTNKNLYFIKYLSSTFCT